MPHIGIGLRAPHIEDLYACLQQHNTLFTDNVYNGVISWLEVHPENYIHNRGPHYDYLCAIARQIPISLHAVGLSLGSSNNASFYRHVEHLQQLIDTINPILVSDHLSFSYYDDVYYNDLLPVYYDEAHLTIMVDAIHYVQDTLKRPLLIENPSRYMAMGQGFKEEGDFLTLLQQKTGCFLVMDINNIVVSYKNSPSSNRNFDWHYYPIHAIKEIHMAGHIMHDNDGDLVAIDTHSRPIAEETWPLLRHLLPHLSGDEYYLMEWDSDIPAIDIVAQQAVDIANFIDKHG